MAASGPRLALGYWPGCYSQQGVLAWLLQPTGGTGLAAIAQRIAWGAGPAATARRGHWPGC